MRSAPDPSAAGTSYQGSGVLDQPPGDEPVHDKDRGIGGLRPVGAP
ncbi:hypothetical protein [Frigoriglobus tundricola]|nr:hypothetical protein [Frigoriglobus tundricola]